MRGGRLPGALDTCGCRSTRPSGRVTAEPVWARRRHRPSTPPRWTASRCAPRETVGATRDRAGAARRGRVRGRRHRRPDPRRLRRRRHARGRPRGRRRRVELRRPPPPYQHVRSIGEDVSAAELLLPAGHRLRPVDVAAAGAAGVTELVVRRRPVVAVIPTGDEIRPLGVRARPGRAARHELADARRPGRGGRLRGAPLRDRRLTTRQQIAAAVQRRAARGATW